MSCLEFHLRFSLPSWMKGRKKVKDSGDYVYFNWEFKTDMISSEREEGTVKCEETKIQANPALSKFENIHSWLDSQEYSDYFEDYKSETCFSEDENYSEVFISQEDFIKTKIISRHNSESSLCSFDSFLSAESSYSLQLREQSKTIFK